MCNLLICFESNNSQTKANRDSLNITEGRILSDLVSQTIISDFKDDKDSLEDISYPNIESGSYLFHLKRISGNPFSLSEGGFLSALVSSNLDPESYEPLVKRTNNLLKKMDLKLRIQLGSLSSRYYSAKDPIVSSRYRKDIISYTLQGQLSQLGKKSKNYYVVFLKRFNNENIEIRLKDENQIQEVRNFYHPEEVVIVKGLAHIRYNELHPWQFHIDYIELSSIQQRKFDYDFSRFKDLFVEDLYEREKQTLWIEE